MSTIVKIGIGVGVVAILFAAAIMSHNSAAPLAQKSDRTAPATPSTATTLNAGVTVTAPTTPSADVSAKDTSDAALDTDMSAIDAQTSALGADTANVDKGLNDQPVSQAE